MIFFGCYLVVGWYFVVICDFFSFSRYTLAEKDLTDMPLELGLLTSKIALVHSGAEWTTGIIFIWTSALFQITVNFPFKTNKILFIW